MIQKTIKLHIVNNGETLDSICKHYNCPKQDVIILNHLFKEELSLNKPLLIPIEVKEETRNKKEYTLDKENKIITLYMIKEVYLSSILYEDAFDIEYNKTTNYLNKLNLKDNVKNYIKKILTFPILLKRKDPKSLIDYENNLNKELNKLKEEIDEKSFSNLSYISEQFQLYLLKIGTKNFEEADLIFQRIFNTIYL